MFLKISQNSQENTCARASSLIKPQACNFIKKETLAQVFSCEFREIFKNTYFYRILPVAASVEINTFCQELKYDRMLLPLPSNGNRYRNRNRNRYHNRNRYLPERFSHLLSLVQERISRKDTRFLKECFR